MTNMRLIVLGTVVLSVVVLAGCSRTVQPPSSAVSNVAMSSLKGPNDLDPSNQESFNLDMDAEAAVSQGCLKAWRSAIAGDEKAAMSELDDLDHKYPKMTTVTFMKAQCLEKLGKKDEAIKFYQKAVTGKEFSSIHLLKLAEALRTTGKADQALPYYRRLIKSDPDFVPFKLAYAKGLLAVDKHSGEASKQLTELTEKADSVKEAKYVEEAKALLREMGSGNDSAR